MSVALNITVACSPAAREVFEVVLTLAPGSTVADAIHASALLAKLPSLDSNAVGVWGRKAPLNQELRDGDRVEIYRPLTVDPKVARRERFFQTGR